MVLLGHKRCSFDGCIKEPIFNFVGEKKGMYCLEHKTDGMVDVINRSKLCKYKNCTTRGCFNFATEKCGLYCCTHKLNDMIDVTKPKCHHDGCAKRPFYNLPTEPKPILCSDHKTANMINVTVKPTTCKHSKCKNLPIFGHINGKKQYCSDHKLENMVNLDIEFKCCAKDCVNEYDFLIENKKYCLTHCPNKDYEIKLKKKCKICDIEENSNYVCDECKKLINKKEWAIIRYIKKHIDTQSIHNSSKQLGNCTIRRPDLHFQLDTHDIIVEIDENQHKSYNDKCECARINEIVSSIGGKSVIFIRYNPDKTYNCKKLIEFEQNEKLKLLIKTIKTELIREYDIFCVNIIQLFYDDNYKKYKSSKREDITDVVAV